MDLWRIRARKMPDSFPGLDLFGSTRKLWNKTNIESTHLGEKI